MDGRWSASAASERQRRKEKKALSQPARQGGKSKIRQEQDPTKRQDHNSLFFHFHTSFVVFGAVVNSSHFISQTTTNTSIFCLRSSPSLYCLHLNINKCYPNTSPLPLQRLQPSLALSPQTSMGMAISFLLALETMLPIRMAPGRQAAVLLRIRRIVLIVS